MAHAPTHAQRSASEDATIAALAKQTRTSPDVVQHLFNEELAALTATATVKNFIRVIAGRRVKQRLMKKVKAHTH